MIDAYGVLSTDRALPTDALDGWALTDSDGRFTNGGVAIAAKTRDEQSHRPAVARDGRIRCWVIGNVYSFNENAGGNAESYESRPAEIDAARYCASLYVRYGIESASAIRGADKRYTQLRSSSRCDLPIN